MAYLLKFSVPCSSRLSSFTYLAHLLAVDKANEPSGPITEVLEAKQEGKAFVIMTFTFPDGV